MATELPLDGCVVPGGLGYSISELEHVVPVPVRSSVPELDAVSDGGLLPGAVWTLAGPPRAGVTELAVRIAVGASRVSRVIVANGHLATHLLVRRVTDQAVMQDASQAVGDRLSVASWLPLPRALDDGRYSWDSACEAADVVVMDTLDEMLRPAALPTSNELLLLLRGLRETARRHDAAVVLTARTAENVIAGDGDQWWQHVARTAFEDVGDVQIRVRAGSPGYLDLETYVRGVGQHDLTVSTSDRRRREHQAQQPG